jgi:hypothetical protein
VAVINSRVAERTHLKQNMGKMDMPKIKPIIRSVAWGALTLFSSGVIAQTPNHLATDPILPFRAAAPSLPSQAQLDAQPQLSLPSDQQIRQAQSRQTEDFKKGMAKAEGGPGAGSGFRPFSGAASDQQRDAYRQSVNAASSQFTERFARSATDEKVAAGLARPGRRTACKSYYANSRRHSKHASVGTTLELLLFPKTLFSCSFPSACRTTSFAHFPIRRGPSERR